MFSDGANRGAIVVLRSELVRSLGKVDWPCRRRSGSVCLCRRVLPPPHVLVGGLLPWRAINLAFGCVKEVADGCMLPWSLSSSEVYCYCSVAGDVLDFAAAEVVIIQPSVSRAALAVVAAVASQDEGYICVRNSTQSPLWCAGCQYLLCWD